MTNTLQTRVNARIARRPQTTARWRSGLCSSRPARSKKRHSIYMSIRRGPKPESPNSPPSAEPGNRVPKSGLGEAQISVPRVDGRQVGRQPRGLLAQNPEIGAQVRGTYGAPRFLSSRTGALGCAQFAGQVDFVPKMVVEDL